MAYSARFSVAGDSGQGIRRGARRLGNAGSHARPQYGQGRNRISDLGRGSKAERPAAVETAGRSARRNFVRRFDWDTAGVEQLIANVERELAAGYQRIKIKVKPGLELKPVEALRKRWPR